MVGPITKRISSAYVSLCSYLLICVGCLFFGPSYVLGFDDSFEDRIFCEKTFGTSCYDRLDQTKPDYKKFCDDLRTICFEDAKSSSIKNLVIGLVILGTASGTVIVPMLLELVTAVKDAVGVKPGANEKGSALFTMFGAVGSIIATILGSFLF